MDIAVKCHGLTKTFDGFAAVDHIDLNVGKGIVFGFLGPNGAGKTTTIRMLACLIRPTSGSASVWGMDVERDYMSVKKIIGYLPESPGYYPEMTPLEFLRYFGRLFRVKNLDSVVEEALKKVGLYDERGLEVRSFSLGMRQRLNIARLLIHDPKLLFLDEPTSGLDPRGTREVRDLIRALGEAGKTIFVCTHILPEVEMICQEVGIINRGRIVAVDSPEGLRNKVKASNVIEVGIGPGGTRPEDLVTMIKSISWAKDVTMKGEGVMAVEVGTLEEKRPELARLLVQWGAELLCMNLQEPTLEDVFMSYTR